MSRDDLIVLPSKEYWREIFISQLPPLQIPLPHSLFITKSIDYPLGPYIVRPMRPGHLAAIIYFTILGMGQIKKYN